MNNKLKIFSGRSNPALAKKIAKSLGSELGEISISTFSDGELWIKFEENIRMKHGKKWRDFTKDALAAKDKERNRLKPGEVKKLVDGKWVSNKD